MTEKGVEKSRLLMHRQVSLLEKQTRSSNNVEQINKKVCRLLVDPWEQCYGDL